MEPEAKKQRRKPKKLDINFRPASDEVYYLRVPLYITLAHSAL